MNSCKIYDYPVSTTDLFVTTVAITGQELPDRTYDGVDLIAKVNTNAVAHEYLFYRKGFNKVIRTPEYKLIWNSELEADTLLYRTDQDPGELINIYRGNEKLANTLFSVYANWEKELLPPAWPSVVYFNFTNKDNQTYVFEN